MIEIVKYPSNALVEVNLYHHKYFFYKNKKQLQIDIAEHNIKGTNFHRLALLLTAASLHLHTPNFSGCYK